MKRSEMLKIIEQVVGGYMPGGMDNELLRIDCAEEVLLTIEKEGMLPPKDDFLEQLLNVLTSKLPVFGNKTALEYIKDGGDIGDVLVSFKRIYK